MDVSGEVMEGLVVEALARNDDFVSFKVAVGFVAWQEEFVVRISDADSVAACDLPPILEWDFVRECEFAQTEEAKKSCEDHGDEQEVVMEGGITVVVSNLMEVVSG